VGRAVLGQVVERVLASERVGARMAKATRALNGQAAGARWRGSVADTPGTSLALRW